ncbi:3-keto-5-aminohexanoate cleavage protein [Spirillospora sp. NPDC048911]|uniref:3-keto-5-aminohexanoate cleavage protein n=1 Tax=Spirillospora sp. NPDC048911 TaxID=3364527 RepID=UPI0037248C26
MLQVCPNGPLDHSVPLSPDQLAVSARDAVVAGAEDIHLHPKGPDGADSLEPDHVAAAVRAVRTAAPGIRVGVTTGAWACPDPRRRLDLVASWKVLPDHASVNWHEEGAELVADALLDHGVAIEAGIFSGTDAARRFLAWPSRHRVLRVLAEVVDTDPETAPATAAALLAELEPNERPVLLHGEQGGAWPVLRLAASLGLDTRIGLEDTMLLPDGSEALDNASLVRAARSIFFEHAGSR